MIRFTIVYPYRSIARQKCRLLLGLLMLGLLGCDSKLDSSRLKHQWADLFRQDYPEFMWQKMTREEFLQQKLAKGEAYPVDDPAQLRLQTWVTAMDRNIRQAFKHSAIPQPTILLIKNSSLNAYVTSARICPEQVSIEVTGSEGILQGDYLSIGPNRNWFYTTGKSKTCINRQLDRNELLQIVAWFLPDSKACWTLQPDKELQINLAWQCLPDSQRKALAAYKSFKGIQYNTAANIIVIHDKMLELPENQLLTVIAHELAHYYKAHVFEHRGEYDYFYQIDVKVQLAGKPQALSSSDSLNELGQQTLKDGLSIIKTYPVAEQQLHSLVFNFVDVYHGWLSSQCPEGSKCQKPCQELSSFFQSQRSIISLGGFPRSSALPKGPHSSDFYFSYEEKARACFQELTFQACSKPCSDLRDSFKDKLAIFGLPDLAKSLPWEDFENARQTFDFISKILPMRIDESNAKVFASIQEANKRRLGYYTSEQEADEFGLELAARMGINPKDAIESFLSLLKIKQEAGLASQKIPGELGFEECSKAYRDGFPEFIPLANYHDPHHSACFRAYNLFREAEAHKNELAEIFSGSPASLKID